MSQTQPHAATLIIFELLPPYGKEIATVLALPNGFKLRFRFKRKWFVTDRPLQICDTDGLIALRITQTADILPIRFCRIIEVKDIGDIIYIQVQVDALVELNSGGASQSEQLARFNRDFRETSLSGVSNLPGVGMDKLILIGPKYNSYFGNTLYCGADENRQAAAWGTLVEILIKQVEFRGLDFLYIIDCEGGDSILQHVRNGEFNLEAEHYYKLRVMQRRSEIDPKKEISLKVDGVSLKAILDKQVAVGAYDILEFSFFTTERQSSPQKSALILSASGAECSTLFSPIILPVVIPARSKWLQVCAGIIFILSAITLVAPNFIAHILFQPPGFITEEIRSLCILLAILTSKSVGALSSLIINKTFHLGS